MCILKITRLFKIYKVCASSSTFDKPPDHRFSSNRDMFLDVEIFLAQKTQVIGIFSFVLKKKLEKQLFFER